MASTFTSANYDGKTCLQLQIEMSESNFASDGSYSTVIASYYLIAVNQPYGALSGDVTSDYGTGQTITCSIGSVSNTFSTNAFQIANAVNSFGDKYYIGSLSTVVNRGSSGNANVRVSCSCTLTWRSGYPSRSISGVYKCINTKSTVLYSANGGTNAPASQIKCYGHILTLSNDVPVRSGYIFKGWSSSSVGSVEYVSGGSYGVDKDITLYAVWKMVDVDITLTGVDISIPCKFYDGIGGFKYFYSDDTYRINIPYSYSFPDKINFAYARTDKSEYQRLYGDSGEITIGINEVAYYIDEQQDESSVDIPIWFQFKIGTDEVTIKKSVTCNLVDFNLFHIRLHHAYVSREADNLVYATFQVTYPKSYNPDVQYINSFPLLVYNSESGLKALDCVGRIQLDENIFLVTYNFNTSGVNNPVNIMYPGHTLIYNSNFDQEQTLQRSDFDCYILVSYPQSNGNIILNKSAQVKAGQLVETQYLNGFYRSGYICTNEIIESDIANEISMTKYSTIAKEFIEQ